MINNIKQVKHHLSTALPFFLSSSTQVLNQSSQTKVKRTNLNLPSRDKSSLQSILISSAYKLGLNLFLNILYFLEKVPGGGESALSPPSKRGERVRLLGGGCLLFSCSDSAVVEA